MTLFSRNMNYCDNSFTTHQPRVIYDQASGSQCLFWDAGGMPIQYIHYAPYGELIANQQTIGYDERYKFTGKEHDCETGKGDNSIAQQISNLIPEATIVAPTEEIKAAVEDDRTWLIGVAKNEASTLDEMKKPENFGQWRVFRNGEQIGTSVNGTIDFIYKDEY